MKLEFYLKFTIFIILISLTVAEDGYLNRECINKNDCGSFGYYCSNNRTCQCDKWYIPNKTREKCIGGVYQLCKYDEHCIEGAFCEHQTSCKCKEFLYPEENGMICSSSHKNTLSVQFLPIGMTYILLKVVV